MTATHEWRVVTWNLHGSASPDLVRIAAALRGMQPDAVALQEVQRRQARALARMLGWRRRWARKHHPYSPIVWWRTEGHAVLSPHRITDARRTSLTPGVTTWRWRHRIVLSVTVRHRSTELRVHCTHLSSDSTDERIEQAARVAALVAAEAHPCAVVAGDLNTHPHDLAEIVREFHTAGLSDPGGDSTCPATVPQMRLDMVLVPGTAVVRRQHVPDGGDQWAAMSDHLPVLVQFHP
jgi:endonuclease/exonuclease/phosphatase family metal-dependent hydrolase